MPNVAITIAGKIMKAKRRKLKRQGARLINRIRLSDKVAVRRMTVTAGRAACHK